MLRILLVWSLLLYLFAGGLDGVDALRVVVVCVDVDMVVFY